MRLRRFTDYALRVLMYLGERPHRRCLVREIAAAHGISQHHLVKVANTLGRLGFIETARGRGGGLRLAVAPEALSIGAVVRELEGDEPLIDCGTCVRGSGCELTCAVGTAAGAFYTALDRVVLRDVLQPRPTVV